MSQDFKMPSDRRIESLDQTDLERRLREVARDLFPDRVMDELEVRHLIRVITECSLLLTDVYSEERVDRIMHPDRGLLGSLVALEPRQAEVLFVADVWAIPRSRTERPWGQPSR